MQYSKFNNVYFDFINAKLRQGMKLRIDVGTSINAPVSKWWADNLEDRFIIVIEPNPDCWHAQNLHPRLQQFMNVPKVFGDNDNVYGIEGGCDNVTELEQKDFHIMNYHQGNSSFLMPHNGVIPNDEKDITIDRTEKVDVFSLGMLLDKLDYEYVELIKTDAQGKDLDIMKGLGDHVDRVLHMDCENDVTNQYAGAELTVICFPMLRRLGLRDMLTYLGVTLDSGTLDSMVSPMVTLIKLVMRVTNDLPLHFC